MYSVHEISEIIAKPEFISDYNWVQQSLVDERANQGFLFQDETTDRMSYFVEVVLASSLDWKDSKEATSICKIGGEIAEVLSLQPNISDIKAKRMRFKSALLYERAGLPALASGAINEEDFDSLLTAFMKRRQAFGHLGFTNGVDQQNITLDGLLEGVFLQDVDITGKFIQGNLEAPTEFNTSIVLPLVQQFAFKYNATDVKAFSMAVKKRLDFSTRTNVDPNLFNKLQDINFPAELWPAQTQAIKGGLLDQQYDAWGLAAPTGTGKTFLTRLLILNYLGFNTDRKTLYIVPSRALVYEITSSLQRSLEKLDIDVLAVNPQMVELGEEDAEEFHSAQVLVLTPEKADLLLRIGTGTLAEIGMVIIDEAHHIEADTRGILLELYLWRLRKLVQKDVRFVFLSAVAPNISALTAWLGKNPHSELIEQRATRMRVGIYDYHKNENNKIEGWINYADGPKNRLFKGGEVKSSIKRKSLVQLTEKVRTRGTVLVVCSGKRECEKLGTEMVKWLEENNKLVKLSDEEKASETYNRLDSRLEREMYPTVPMRKLIKNRIAYHHAGLPPRVRTTLEDAIKEGLVDYVFATTTLAEGVNFPFSTVIVQALAFREQPEKNVPTRYRVITPRTFWNIAGRAGRPGFDKEGQVILFKPSLGLDKVSAVLDHYLNPNIKDIAPVKSALSRSMEELQKSIEAKEIKQEDLEHVELPSNVPKRVRGAINLLRVGLVHAKATGIAHAPEDILEGSFASQFLSKDLKVFGKALIKKQSVVIDNFFNSPTAPSDKIVAEMGLSLDTVAGLRDYVVNLEDWKIKSFRKLFYGSRLNLDQAVFTIGPVSKLIGELEGNKLGGFLSDVIAKWLTGVPLVVVRNNTTNRTIKNSSIENLISVIYSRIQFLLPWGLYAVDCMIQEEASKRSINYGNEVKNLAYLSDEGVPNFDALRLVNLDFERVDATRLSEYYYKIGGIKTGVDIVGWLNSQSTTAIENVLRGLDNRRQDFDLHKVLDGIKKNTSSL